MAKNKKPADAAKDKAAKQKKIAIVLVCVLALAVAYAVNTMMGMSGGGAASKPQAVDPGTAASTTPVATVASPVPVAPSLAGSTVVADPAAATAGSTSAGSTQLLAAVSPPADAGQLQSFSQFTSRDPFAGGSGSASASGGSGSGTKSGGSSGSGSGSAPAVPPAPPNPPPSAAVISVNGGLPESVSTDGIFPTASTIATTNGLFKLVSLTAKTATVSVVGGSYASGSQTLKLTVGKSVTLVNTADGTRYTLLLYPPGTAVPAAPAATGASGAAVPVTPPATTTAPTTTTTGG
ncbi:MAG TPA: hypothetical protein VJ375_14320 [Gaiellaceae bacterium]|nr:hypothetical protein [Gaiellaceae bacterium]